MPSYSRHPTPASEDINCLELNSRLVHDIARTIALTPFASNRIRTEWADMELLNQQLFQVAPMTPPNLDEEGNTRHSRCNRSNRLFNGTAQITILTISKEACQMKKDGSRKTN